MSEIHLYLVPSPGTKPEFLSIVKPIDPSPSTIEIWKELHDKIKISSLSSSSSAQPPPPMIVLEDYTRDGWSWKPSTTDIFHTIKVISIDGKHKLPGFLKYLKDRQKSSYGRIPSSTYIIVISYIQLSVSSVSNDEKNDRMEIRICKDMTKIPNCTIKPKILQQQTQQPIKTQRPPTAVASTTSHNVLDNNSNTLKGNGTTSGTTTTTTNNKGMNGGGLLGKLLGAQQRTNMHVAISKAKTQPIKSQQLQQQATVTNPAATTTVTNHNNHNKNGDEIAVINPLQYDDDDINNHNNDMIVRKGSIGSSSRSTSIGTKTAQEVFMEFRQFCQEQMLDFDTADEEILKIPINIKDHLAELVDDEYERSKVTVEILKYMIYEAAEEVNEEWIAYKEPIEYLDDDIIITIYKEGAAPMDVLEEINRGELPTEILGQQRELANQKQKQVQIAEMKHKKHIESIALQKKQDDHDEDDDDDELAILNTKKRDRRSAEDYMREKSNSNNNKQQKR